MSLASASIITSIYLKVTVALSVYVLSTANVFETLDPEQMRISATSALNSCNQAGDCMGRSAKCSVEHLFKKHSQTKWQVSFSEHCASRKILLLEVQRGGQKFIGHAAIGIQRIVAWKLLTSPVRIT